MSTVNIIFLYVPLFSISVALNFTYAASSSLRETIKSGFLIKSRALEEKAVENCKKASSILEVTMDLEDPKQIKKDLESLLSGLKKLIENLEIDVEKYQSIAAKNIKSAYIFTAIISIFILFLAGQEAFHSTYPSIEALSILGLGFLGLVFIYCKNLFTKDHIQASTAGALSLLLIAISVTMPYMTQLASDYKCTISNKTLTNLLLVLSFTPFVIAYITFSSISFWINIKYKTKVDTKINNIDELLQNLDNLTSSKNYFKKNHQSP